MPYVAVAQENSAPVELYYEDHRRGNPVVLIHGFPLSGRAWERQERALIAAGHRVITYDRRGFGKSSQPGAGYDYDTFAADLDKFVTALDLRNFDIAGHSMGGGEIAACVPTWHADFRADLPKIDIPVLVMHGTADRILPYEACGPRTHEQIPGSEFEPIQDASHGLCWTHAEEVNSHLVPFFS